MKEKKENSRLTREIQTQTVNDNEKSTNREKEIKDDSNYYPV
jgi:hypothetical protein